VEGEEVKLMEMKPAIEAGSQHTKALDCLLLGQLMKIYFCTGNSISN
jgi:hypothetical protein